MLPFDFEYYKPHTAEEAAGLYSALVKEGKAPVYYGGGTELITRARVGNITFGAVIDLKGIPNITKVTKKGGDIIIGACASLADVAASGAFPLMASVVKRIADHTAQYKITVGGNVMGSIIYKEALLPLLLADAEIETFGPEGKSKKKLSKIYDKKLALSEGEFIKAFILSKAVAALAWYHRKEVKSEKIDYPLITLAAVNDKGKLKAAASGLYPYPAVIEEGKINGDILSDMRGSAEFRIKTLDRLIGEAKRATGI